MPIARALKRFVTTYSVVVFTLVGLTVVLLQRWLSYSPECGCSQYAVLPLVLPLIGLGAIVFVMGGQMILTFWRTRLYQQHLSQGIITRTRYQGIAIYTVDQTAPVAVSLGYLRPAVYISQSLVQRLDGFELLAVIQHEVAHAHRFDPLQRLWLLAVPRWLPIWRTQISRYLAGQEILADTMVSHTPSLQSAFVKLVDQLQPQPAIAATWFSASQARIDHWLGQPIALPNLRLTLLIAGFVLSLLLLSYRAWAVEPAAQAFGQCLSVQTMCESMMSYVVQ